ncbi:MAG: PaaI family thioesterase [Flavobacteriales bacterium]|nr:PaaI family thioesterase [Flavobacteriales bacterium]
MEYQKLVDLCNQMSKNTLMETLQITYTAAGEGWLQATMPVNSRVHQPMGLLHGGAMVALAESVGSAASVSRINPKEQEVRGIEIAANHLKSVREGLVTATAKIIHQGKSLHLWEIRIENEKGELVSLCKLTNMILTK